MKIKSTILYKIMTDRIRKIVVPIADLLSWFFILKNQGLSNHYLPILLFSKKHWGHQVSSR